MKTLKQKYDKTVKAYLDAFCQKNGAEIVEALPYLSHIKIRPVFLVAPMEMTILLCR